jgi:hypothetical protein
VRIKEAFALHQVDAARTVVRAHPREPSSPPTLRDTHMPAALTGLAALAGAASALMFAERHAGAQDRELEAPLTPRDAARASR